MLSLRYTLKNQFPGLEPNVSCLVANLGFPEIDLVIRKIKYLQDKN